MEIIKAATEWAKAEVVSAIIFMLFGLAYILGSLGFWKLGNTPLTKALVIPLLIAGVLLLGAGISFYLSNKSKLTNFEKGYKENPSAMINSEMERTGSTIKTYENVALKVFPAIIILAAMVSFFVPNPLVRAISIAIIAFLLVLVLLDSQALKRIKTYHHQLELVDKQLEEK